MEGDDGCTAMWMHLIDCCQSHWPVHLKPVKMVNFILCIFLPNKKKENKWSLGSLLDLFVKVFQPSEESTSYFWELWGVSHVCSRISLLSCTSVHEIFAILPQSLFTEHHHLLLEPKEMDPRWQKKIGSKSSFGFAFYTECIKIMIPLPQYLREFLANYFFLVLITIPQSLSPTAPSCTQTHWTNYYAIPKISSPFTLYLINLVRLILSSLRMR